MQNNVPFKTHLLESHWIRTYPILHLKGTGEKDQTPFLVVFGLPVPFVTSQRLLQWCNMDYNIPRTISANIKIMFKQFNMIQCDLELYFSFFRQVKHNGVLLFFSSCPFICKNKCLYNSQWNLYTSYQSDDEVPQRVKKHF